MKSMKYLYSGLIVTSLAAAMACTPTGGKKNEGGAVETAETVVEPGSVLGIDDVDDSMNDMVKGERYRVTVDGEDMMMGDLDNPLVTITEFSDFQCPFCKRFSEGTLHEIMDEFAGQGVRLVFKQMPLPPRMHPQAMISAQAALAANAQGKGWEMHDKMFTNQKEGLKKENLIAYAEEIGIPDLDAFKAALDGNEYEQAVKDDQELARKIAVNSTPTFFINGRPMKDRSPANIKKVIKEEIELGNAMVEKGATAAEVYPRIMKAAKETRKPEQREAKQRPGAPDPEKSYAVPVDDSPAWGKPEALVTIVEFSDFQCPFCRRVVPTLDKIKEEYPDDVRIVFRQLPLPMHPQAPGAAKASLAAHKQGKFWEMHDALFASAQEVKAADWKTIAGKIDGLDVAQFEKDMASKELDEMMKKDGEVAQQFGARGTPAFFVNGRFISGAQEFATFKALIDEEKTKAEKFMADKGVEAKDVYAEMSKGWEKEVKVPPPPPVADFKRRQVDTKGLTGKGNLKNPKITILECSDFDCPYCKRATDIVDQVMKEYGDKVAFYFRHYPLPMHKNAEPAHRAAIAADNQGKLWEMHDKLFEDQKARSEDDFVKYAEEIGLDVEKFKKDFADPKTAQKVQDDMEVCKQLNVRGAPGFLINGRLMSGAQPFPRVKTVLDEELNGGFEATQKKEAAAKKDGGDKPDPKAIKEKKGDE